MFKNVRTSAKFDRFNLTRTCMWISKDAEDEPTLTIGALDAAENELPKIKRKRRLSCAVAGIMETRG